MSAQPAQFARPAFHPESDATYAVLCTPGVLVFADDSPRRAGLVQAIEDMGGRVVASGALTDAIGALDRGGANVVIDVGGHGEGDGDGDGGAALDILLDRLNALVRDGRRSALVLTPLDLLDPVVARIDDPGVAILVDAEAAERDAALAALAAVPAPRVAEDGEAENRRRLAQLGEEVGRIARALAALSSEPQRATPAMAPRSIASHAPLVRAILRLRQLRGLHFERAMFADPAWDILLDLTAARIEGRLVAVSSLCIAAAVPATTALRWIAQMTEQALLVRQPDANDGRRVFIALSDAAANAMDAYCTAAGRIVAPAG